MTGKTYHPGEYRPRSRMTPQARAGAVRQAQRSGAHIPSLAVAAGVSPSTLRKALQEDQEFRDLIEKASAVPLDRAIKALQERAIDGVPGFNGERKYSDRLLAIWLAALDPERFGNRVKVEQETRVTVDLPDTRKWPREAKIKMLEALALAKAAGAPPGAPLSLPGSEAVDAEFVEHGEPQSAEEDDGDLPEE